MLMSLLIDSPQCTDRWRLGLWLSPYLLPCALLLGFLLDAIGLLAFPLVVPVPVFYVSRVRRCSVTAAGDKIIIKNVFWTHRVQVSDVVEIRGAKGFVGKEPLYLSSCRRGWRPRVLIHASAARAIDCRKQWIEWAGTVAPVASTGKTRDYLKLDYGV